MKANLHSLDYYYKAVKGNEGKMCEIIAVLEKALCHLEAENYMQAMVKLHDIVCGPHFDECLAKEAVAAMRNVDKTKGGHWTMEQTNQFATQCGVKEKCDFYYVINMLYSDFADVLGREDAIYIKLAKAYINDPDAEPGKPLRLYLAQ
jgi:hypothetical protein